MKTFYCAYTDIPYISKFFTDRDIGFTYTELDHSYEIQLTDEEFFLLRIHGGWEAVIDYTIEARKHNDLIRSTIPRVTTTK
jgi:hypothetical protein